MNRVANLVAIVSARLNVCKIDMLATSVLGDWPCSVPVSRLVGFGKEIEVYDCIVYSDWPCHWQWQHSFWFNAMNPNCGIYLLVKLEDDLKCRGLCMHC